MIKYKFYISGAILLMAFYAVQCLMPAWFQALFHRGQFNLLSLLTGADGPQSVGFYLGRGEELLWGPVLQVISAGLLILVALGPWKDLPSRCFFGVILGFLILTKWNVLGFPPYGDAVGGPCAEGWWLAQNNFDYIGLFHQPGYAAGGPRVYFTSAFPTYLALMYKVFPSVKLFLVANHLVFFAMAAAVVTAVRSIGRRVFCREAAGLLAVLVLSWPVFQTQLEAINMEMPSLFFAMLSAWALTRGRIHPAGACALLSLLFKGSGIFACAAFAAVGACDVFGKIEGRRRNIWIAWSICLLGMAGLSVAAKYWMGDQHTNGVIIRFLAGWPSLKIFPITWYFLANGVVLAGLWLLRGKDDASWRVNRVMLIFAGMWFLLFLNFQVLAPRYRVAVYPFLLFTLFWTFARLVPDRVRQVAVLVTALVVVQFHAYGFRNNVIPVDYVLLEENLQYRNDLKLYQALAEKIENKYAGASAVVAPFITAQALAIPEFGYVSRSRPVAVYGFPCVYGGVRMYPGMAALDIKRTIYTTMTIDEGTVDRPYPLHPNDKVLEVVEVGNRKAWIFMGGFAIEMMRRMQEYMILQRRSGRS